jgi:hypothetical protein
MSDYPAATAEQSSDEAQTRREELAMFLRARRDQLQPEDVGLERRGRRRVPGLRREEVADLAYVSVTWYTWLEQGRDVHASALALDGVSRALRLDDEARDYVRRLAGKPATDSPTGAIGVGPILARLLDDLLPNSACLVNGSYDLLGWNSAYVALFGDPDEPASRTSDPSWPSIRARHGCGR